MQEGVIFENQFLNILQMEVECQNFWSYCMFEIVKEKFTSTMGISKLEH